MQEAPKLYFLSIFSFLLLFKYSFLPFPPTPAQHPSPAQTQDRGQCVTECEGDGHKALLFSSRVAVGDWLALSESDFSLIKCV